MTDTKKKPTGGEIDPKLKDEKDGKPGSSTPPVNPSGGVRRENESDANRDNDGQRKRAEEGL